MIKIIFRKPYIYWIIGIFALYLAINIIVSGFYNNIPLVIYNFSTINWLKLGISIFLTLAIGVLVAVNAVYAYILYRERKRCIEGSAVAGVGTVGGLIAGVCPLCITGLLPLIFGLFGISFTFATLPFGGIEVQILVLIILIVSLWMLGRK